MNSLFNPRKFDLKFEPHLKKLKILANKIIKEKNRSWHCEIMFYDDGDFKITLASVWANHKDNFVFSKSANKYYYRKELIDRDMGVEIE